jgi:hypothetical protein
MRTLAVIALVLAGCADPAPLPPLDSFRADSTVIETGGRSIPVSRLTVSVRFFEVTGVQPVLGRPFMAEEYAGPPRVAALSYRFWQAEMAGDPAVIGRSLPVGGVPHTVVAILPEGFDLPGGASLCVPGDPDMTPLAHRSNPSS